MATGQLGRYAPPACLVPSGQTPYSQAFEAGFDPSGVTPSTVSCVAALEPEHSKLDTKTCGLPLPRTSATPTEYMSFGSRMYRAGSTPSRVFTASGSLMSTGQPGTRSPLGRHAYTLPSKPGMITSRRLPPSSGASVGYAQAPRCGSRECGLPPRGVGTAHWSAGVSIARGKPGTWRPRASHAYARPFMPVAAISSVPSPCRSPTATPEIGSRRLRNSGCVRYAGAEKFSGL